MNKISKIESDLDKLLNGDPTGEKLIFIKYYPYVMSICLRYSKDRSDAEEILNDTFLKAFNKISTYNKNKPFRPWIGTIAVNTSIDFLRKKKKEWLFIELKDEMDPYEEDILEWEENALVLPVIQELSNQYRLVFNLFVFEEYSHKEIAEKLNISIGTSKSNFARAKKIVKARLLKIRQQKAQES